MKHEMLRNIDAVIFDMDGSLVDSMWMWRSIDIEYLGRYGIPLPESLQADIEGMSFGETALYFKEHFPIPDSVEEIMQTWNRMAWDKYCYEVPLKEGIPEFLRVLPPAIPGNWRKMSPRYTSCVIFSPVLLREAMWNEENRLPISI